MHINKSYIYIQSVLPSLSIFEVECTPFVIKPFVLYIVYIHV